MLPELDQATAHTLVHYLYTGKYQALKPSEVEKVEAHHEYKLGACVYCAAVRYQIPGLAELAKNKITSLGEDLTILDILSVARENAFPGLPDQESWFPAYLEKAIKDAVSKDPELFTRPEFVHQIQGDIQYRQVVMQAIVSSYAQKPADVNEQPTGLSTPVAEPTLVEPSLVDGSEVEALDLDPVEPAEIDNKEHQVIDVDTPKKGDIVTDDSKKDAIEPEKIETVTKSSPQAPDSFTDEVGFGSSKMYKNFGGKKAESVDPETITSNDASRPTHKRSDSVMQATEVASTDSLPVVDEKAVASPEPTNGVPVVVDEANTDAKAPKKKNKNKKKKASAAKADAVEN
jgi:hypothetical protein